MIEYENGKYKVFHLKNKPWYNYLAYPVLSGIICASLTSSNKGAFAGIIVGLLFAFSAYCSDNKYINHINDTYDVLNATEAGDSASWTAIEHFSN